MASLTEISVATRKFAVFLAITIIAFLVIRGLVRIGISYYKSQNPAPQAPPDVKFSKLPSPDFGKDSTVSAGLTFTLLTIDGHPPNTTGSAKIYSMPKKLSTILSTDRAKKFAAKLGFNQEPISLNATNFFFTDAKDPLRTLKLDIVNLNFQLTYDYLKNPSLFNNISMKSKDQVTNDIKSYLTSNALFDGTLLGGSSDLSLYSYNTSTNGFDVVANISNAQAVRMDYYRPYLNNLPLVTTTFYTSPNSVIYTPTTNELSQFLSISYTFWPIAFDDSGTYPLRTGNQAWTDLTEGRGIVVSMGTNTSNNPIIIRKIYLAYYDSILPQQYLQPVFVFEGDNKFAAYVPAITSEWLE